jgi:ubiquitin-conjugating enzyme E2 O
MYPLERLTKLYDGIEQIEDDVWGDDPLDPYALYTEDEGQIMWQTETGDNEWEDVDDDVSMEVDPLGWADEVVNESLPSPSSGLHGPAPHDMPYVVPPLMRDAKVELAWKRFDILPCAPHDHAYISSTPSQPSKSFLGRLTKEYRVLSSSLPGLCKVQCHFLWLKFLCLLKTRSSSVYMKIAWIS